MILWIVTLYHRFYQFIPATTNDLAYSKQAIQSSTHYSSTASKAVDGDQITKSLTKGEKDPYWSVDLGMRFRIDYLFIKNNFVSTGELFHLHM